jgi:hypothetical protein
MSNTQNNSANIPNHLVVDDMRGSEFQSQLPLSASGNGLDTQPPRYDRTYREMFSTSLQNFYERYHESTRSNITGGNDNND